MPQETNLNVSPYFDDFDSEKNYYKVLFKPGYPIQARELTTLQSILQNQIENHGKNIFKEGSVVYGGEIAYNNPVYAVEIDPNFNGVPVSLYFDQLLNAKIRGANTNVVAEVQYILKDTDSERGNYTLYVNYLQSGGADFTTKVFADAETLLLDTPVTYGNFTIQVGQGFCNTKTSNATSLGTLLRIKDGVYFVRGFFAKALDQSILLDQYGTSPSYRVGYDLIESVVTADEDETLFDNAQGFSNYAAAGADRFKLELKLIKKGLNDLEDNNFVEVFRVINGVPEYSNHDPQYNIIRDYMAKRTYDESGNYFVRPFTLFVRDCLNDRVLSNGVYFEDQKTINGNTPSEDKMVYEIGPGKAYVNGYDVETPQSPRLLEVDKSRTTKTVTNQSIQYNAGHLLIVNNIFGTQPIGLGTTATISLMDSRIGVSPHVAAGTTIGVARVYDYILDGDYVNDTSRANLRLFDIQTYTKIGLTTSFNTNLTTPTFVKGIRSNASGYIRETVSAGSTILTLYQVSGQFLENERVSINGIDDGRLINYVRDYSISDIKSVYSKVGVSTFNADLLLDSRSQLAPQGTQFNITASSGGISTISCGLGTNFINKISSGDIISYPNPSFGSDVVYNKVVTVSSGGTNFTVTGITTVLGICDGKTPTTNSTVTNLVKISSSIYSRNSSLMTELNKTNVASVSLEDNEIVQRRIFTQQTISQNVIQITITEPDIYFKVDQFAKNRYLISYEDGSVEPLRNDKIFVDATGKTITFSGLTKPDGFKADVIATIDNFKPNSKSKKLNKATTLVVSNSKLSSSGIGTTTLNDGLTYSQVYGTRVQDEEICLNVPDAVRVLAVYESSGLSDPQLPKLNLTSFTGPSNNNQDFIIGEKLVGKKTGAVGLLVSKNGVNEVEFTYLNLFQFEDGETIEGKESGIKASVVTKIVGDNNISNNFTFDSGQRDTIYDYSRIIRRQSVPEPKGKLKIVFQNYTIDANDTGEFITASSYPEDGFKHDVTSYLGSRLTDYIDIRPRVSPYTLSSKSPFEFDSRDFSSQGQSSTYILAPEENLKISYSFYLGRVDRVYLSTDGTFFVDKGLPSESPIAPILKDNGLDIAIVVIPPYVYNTKNVNVVMSQHKRYRMSDISLLEDRIKRVEEFTTLSMLESKTENFTIKDSETGLDRFKCGFFVDNFTDHQYHDLQNPSFRMSIDSALKILRPTHRTTTLDLQLGSESISDFTKTYNARADHTYVSDLGSDGVRKTGDLITLNYNEILYFEQSFATRSESVTPFLVRYWSGSIQLSPAFDTWVDEKAITTTSFKEVKINADPIPDKNIVNVQNQTVNNTVNTQSPVSQSSGPAAFDWIANAQKMSGDSGWANNGRIGGEMAPIQVEVIDGGKGLHISATKNAGPVVGRRDPAKDDPLIRQLLPPELAEQFINQLNDASNGQFRVHINFYPPLVNTTSEVTGSTSSTSTSTSSTSNTTTVIVPPEITTNEEISTSISHYTEPVRYLRSRNIEFNVRGLKPVTKFYTFFQGIDVRNYIMPKLLEIEMISGKFQIGETVESDPFFVSQKVVFRLCKPNHKEGPYDGSPILGSTPPLIDANGTVIKPGSIISSETYKFNPYTQQPFASDYTESSTVLNVDTKSLQLPSEVDFYGLAVEGMRLIGSTSGAVARVKPIRLISDNNGRLIGSLWIPNPNIVGNPKWTNGQNTLTVIDVETLDQIKLQEFIANSRVNESSAEEDFMSSAITNVAETNILTTRTVTYIPSYNINTTTITNTTTNTTNVTSTTSSTSTTSGPAGTTKIFETLDPLAQSFYVREDTGLFLTSVEVFFETKDDSIPVTFQLRPMVSGVPSNIVIPFSEVTLTPDQINLSTDATVPTKIIFPSPVYLSGPKYQEIRQAPLGSQLSSEYAMVLLSDSSNYRVFISLMGENDKLTGAKVSQQPTLGSLFKSQNGTTWSPAQLEDLKYRIYRANFVSEGSAKFYNPKLSLGNGKLTVTGPNHFTTLSKRMIVGLGSTGYNPAIIVPGVSLVQGSATGTLIGIAGSLTVGTGLTVSNAGFGYTPSSGSYTFTNKSLTSESGYGQGAIANITVNNGEVVSVNVTSGGTGYTQGDTLIIGDLGSNVGYGAKATVVSIASSNTFIIDDVQGDFTAGATNISYINSSGITTYVGAGVTISQTNVDQYYDGRHMHVFHLNHAMHSTENYVKISEMRPITSEVNSTLSSDISRNEVSTISLVSSVGFDTFEGVGVSTVNPGYVIIGNEVIAYTGVSGNSLTGLTRGIDGSKRMAYSSGAYAFKYQLNGISLRRINKIHNMAEVENYDKHPIDLDSYYIKIDTSDTDFDNVGIGSNRPDLYFSKTEQLGMSGTVITNNIQYESLNPKISTIIPAQTNIVTKVRTFTGSSVGGNEVPFIDRGFEEISLNSINYFNEPKLICSPVNESRFITESPGNRSFTMQFDMTTSDSRVSPVIDTIGVSVDLTTNLLNNPIGIQTASNYANDDRVRSLYGDPHTAVYVSKPIMLKLPANSIKVLLSASRNNTNDVRVLYKLIRADSGQSDGNYELFPGYSNYRIDGQGIKRVIDPSLNDGSEDNFITQSQDRSFKDYEYSVDDLPDFIGFVIKIVMAGTNQATPPLVRQLRAIATVKPNV
jgi:hypothetical protein